MAKEMHTAYAERLKANAQRAETMPQEVAALDARLDRLRERLKAGDPDMTSDELQATIERVEAKRREVATATTRSIAGDGEDYFAAPESCRILRPTDLTGTRWRSTRGREGPPHRARTSWGKG